jgi:small redox-active disulfide protein 2
MSLDIKVLGPGCMKCKTLERLTREVVSENNIDAQITKVEDIMEIMQFNVISTPALVINGQVVIKGIVPSKEEIKKQIESADNG